jgi:carbamoyl-phosphate synthase large subunit
LGFPLVIRPSFTLGGTGGAIAYNREEFGEAIQHALDMSPVHEALVEESVLGWKGIRTRSDARLPRQLRGDLHH